MILHGKVSNGVIVLDEQVPLPEGAAVQILIMSLPSEDSSQAVIPTLAERLKDFIGVLEDLPEDAAENHDHYLYGTPKKS